MKNQYTLLHNCYFQFCQDQDPSVLSSRYYPNESMAAPIKRQRISLKRSSSTNQCLIKGERPFKQRNEQEQMRIQTEKVENLKLANMQTMASTHRLEQERSDRIDRIVQTYSTRTQIASNQPNALSLKSKFGSQEKLDTCRQKNKEKANEKMQNVRSQPFCVRKVQNFKEMAALISEVESQMQSPLKVVKSQKKGSKQELKQQNGYKRIVTIYSIQNQTGVQQIIEQSMIQIDFFHPSTRRLLDLEKEQYQSQNRGLGSRLNNA